MSLKNLVKKIFYLNIHTEHLYHLIILKFFPSRVLNYSNFREDINPEDYYKIYRENLKNLYPVVDEIEKELGFKIDNILEFSDKKLKPFTSLDYIFDFSSSTDTSLKYVSSPGTLYSIDVQNQSDHYVNFKLGFDLTSLEGLNISARYDRNQGNDGTKSDTISISGSFKSKSDTEYAIIIMEESFLTSKLNIKKNIRGIDYNFNVNQSLNNTKSHNSANIALSKTF